MGQSSSDPSMSQGIRHNLPDSLRTISVKVLEYMIHTLIILFC